MPALTEVHFQNYRSFLDAKCRLSPVTVVIGANNAGTSNFLRGIHLAGRSSPDTRTWLEELHSSAHRGTVAGHGKQKTMITLSAGEGREIRVDYEPGGATGGLNRGLMFQAVRKYILDEKVIGGGEVDTASPFVHENGEGTTRVLQMLSLRNRTAFSRIEQAFMAYVPEIEELLFERLDQGKWYLQVREKGIGQPVPLSELSAGSRTILALLTILHEPNGAQLILIEDIEHAIHPHGLKPLVESMREIAAEKDVQFIFTTHSPYVLDAFQDTDYWDHVVIVEKRDGVSTLTNAKERLVALGYEREMDKVPLGDLWYSRLLGGVAEPPPVWNKEA